MVSQITQGVKISVKTNFEGTYFKNFIGNFSFSYTITIENHSKDTVQLLMRHWEIYDSLNGVTIVDGEGVVGQKPVLKPGEMHTYNSGCLITSPHGSMKGFFKMINFTSTRVFKVSIPSFNLNVPFALN